MAETALKNAGLYASASSTELGLRTTQVLTTFDFFSNGATVPFLARYRKEQTGSLDEEQLLHLKDRWEMYRELEDRKETVLRRIELQKALTPELKDKIEKCVDRNILEDLYLPFKPKKKSRALAAREAGLEPVALVLYTQELPLDKIEEMAQQFIKAEGFDSIQKVIDGALDILAEDLAQRVEVRSYLRDSEAASAFFCAEVKDTYKEKKTKFENYYHFKEKVKTVPAHRILAVRRAEKEGVLRSFVEMNDAAHESYLRSAIIKDGSPIKELLDRMVIDCYQRLLKPAIETELKAQLKEKADAESIKVFSKNLRDILMAPPARGKVVMGVDPGFKSGTKLAVIDATGKFLEHRTIYPLPPQEEKEASKTILLAMIENFKVDIISIGNGTASREIDEFIAECIKELEKAPIKVTVSEAGASVYSASTVAREEFPELDVVIRGAISIARRVQDPLAELVKIDPKSMGVGQYQHDVKATELGGKLEQVVESCVSSVGVDVNTASESLLSYVSGISRPLAKSIVDFRNQTGSFPSRSALVKVPKFGPKAFEQAAGFLRVFEAENPLDGTAVHPEKYEALIKICEQEGCAPADLIGQPDKVDKVDWKKYVSDTLGWPTLADIQEELKKPNRDPRKAFVYANFDPNIRSLSDLKDGMWLEGVISNVTDFGVFVDIGVHQDGLIHISEMSHRFVSDVKNMVSAGDVVKVRVLSVDVGQKRISLSLKDPSAQPEARPSQPRQQSPRRPEGQGQRGEGGAPRQDRRPQGARPPRGEYSGPRDQQGQSRENYRNDNRPGNANRPDYRPAQQKPQKPHATVEQLQNKFHGKVENKQNQTKLKFSIKSLMKSGR